MRRRFNKGIDNVPHGMWVIETQSHTKQIDGQSCGVFVLKVIIYCMGAKN